MLFAKGRGFSGILILFQTWGGTSTSAQQLSCNRQGCNYDLVCLLLAIRNYISYV